MFTSTSVTRSASLVLLGLSGNWMPFSFSQKSDLAAVQSSHKYNVTYLKVTSICACAHN